MSKTAGKVIIKITVKILSYVILAAIIFAGTWYGFRKFSKIETDTSFTRAQTAFSKCAELASYKMNYSDILMIKKQTFSGLARSYSIIKYQGILRAGIEDISKIEFTILPDRKSIKVKLPPCVLLSNDICKQEVFDEHQNIFVIIPAQEIFNLIEQAKNEAAEEIINDGLLDEADNHAKQVITGLLNAAGFEKVIF